MLDNASGAVAWKSVYSSGNTEMMTLRKTHDDEANEAHAVELEKKMRVFKEQ